MLLKKVMITFLMLNLTVLFMYPDVPPPARVHQPDIPYFLESMNFQTLQMQVFPPEISGMVIDSFSDLTWNPAFITDHLQKSVYLDFNVQDQVTFTVPVFSNYYNYFNYNFSTSYNIQPTWYIRTSIIPVETSPLYNFAAIFPLSHKFTVGIINRSISGNGTFRDTSDYIWRDYIEYREYFRNGGSEPEQWEIEKNQQKAFGNQTELLIGYKLSSKIKLGFRLGYYTYDYDGTLKDAEKGVYTYSTFDTLNDESLKINGHHLATGIGVLFHLNKKTRLGFYGSFTRGKSTEDTNSIYNTDLWSEWDEKPQYYNTYKRSINSRESYSCVGNKPKFTITFERDISSKLTLRSFLLYTRSDIESSGSMESALNFHYDYTYNSLDLGTQSFHFRRLIFKTGDENVLLLNGKEKKEVDHFKWFASVVYSPKKEWALFGGVLIRHYSFKQRINENSTYRRSGSREYEIYQPISIMDYFVYDKNYSLHANYKNWSISLPVGVKLKVFKGLHLIFGALATFSSFDQDMEVNQLFPIKLNRVWFNGILRIDDEEINRREEYSSDPEKESSNSFDQYIGIEYRFPSKGKFCGKLYIRSFGKISQLENWAIGLQMDW